jgi:hypothetical protein
MQWVNVFESTRSCAPSSDLCVTDSPVGTSTRVSCVTMRAARALVAAVAGIQLTSDKISTIEVCEGRMFERMLNGMHALIMLKYLAIGRVNMSY